jgi:hypothetical protein
VDKLGEPRESLLDDARFTWGDYLLWLKRRPVLRRKDDAGHELVV